jgi:hypothetical protein
MAACPLLPLPPKVTTALPPLTIGISSRAAAPRVTRLPPITLRRNAEMGGVGTRFFTCACRFLRPLRHPLLPTHPEAPVGSAMPTSAPHRFALPVLTHAPSLGCPPVIMNALTPRSSSNRAAGVLPSDKVKTARLSKARGMLVASKVAAQVCLFFPNLR